MQRVLYMVVIVLALSGCDNWQPYAALYQPTTQETAPEATPKATGSPTPRAACTVRATYALNLRRDAGTAFEVIGILYTGEALTMTGRQRNTWYEVETETGLIGWINSNYCN